MQNQWGEGFVSAINVTADRAITGWRLALTLPTGATITLMWNGPNSGPD
ncbi:hypothetical protein FDA94_07625 [Herbidospora galbida]|uniref:CBM2 domain-containing protein n=1 Tax=Herbidospora galbida TaxID=2575442 RepID=A0A4U3MJY7_9ACTN|nr:hypothetical protein FDA94_07625 [Herbidospora galbida]